MIGERGGENISDVSLIHYCDRGIVFDRQDAVVGAKIVSSIAGRSEPSCCLHYKPCSSKKLPNYSINT
jgi:hypothetical protein